MLCIFPYIYNALDEPSQIVPFQNVIDVPAGRVAVAERQDDSVLSVRQLGVPDGVDEATLVPGEPGQVDDLELGAERAKAVERAGLESARVVQVLPEELRGVNLFTSLFSHTQK